VIGGRTGQADGVVVELTPQDVTRGRIIRKE